MTMSAHHEPLSIVDAAWLQMDRPTNLMMITALIELADPLSMKVLKQLVEQRLLQHRRFVQRIVQGPFGWPHWARDRSFALDSHLHAVELPSSRDGTTLRDLISNLASTPLSRVHPLWQVHLVQRHGESSALIVRLHHCIANGVALILSATRRHHPPPSFEAVSRERAASSIEALAYTVSGCSPGRRSGLRNAQNAAGRDAPDPEDSRSNRFLTVFGARR
jgi:hypothetical protein